MLKRRYATLSYLYAWFLVYATPLALPVAGWLVYEGRVTLKDILLTFLFYCISGLGITLGYHRLITHRSFEAKPWLKTLLLISGTWAMQGTPASWASLHIQHHSHADKRGDPHSPAHGFWNAHCGWIFHHYTPNFRRYGKWLLQDKIVRHVSQYYLWYSNLGLLLPWLIGGWTCLILAGFVRLFISSHLTWSVNSICHRWGNRVYVNTPDRSRNHFIIALFTFGEGWHNNHHRHLQMPFFCHRWYQIDFGQWALLLFKQLGWVNQFKIPKNHL